MDAAMETAAVTAERLGRAADAISLNNAAVRLHSLLKHHAIVAVNKVPEFGEYGPLKDQFLRNIDDSNHVRIVGHTIKVFDEELAGTATDFMAGWNATRSKFKLDRPKYEILENWKYGIYVPSREAGEVDDWDKFRQVQAKFGWPSYDEVISARLAVWGEKAPYWYFINYGNMGIGAHPQMTATYFVEKTRSQIARILREEMKKVGDELPYGAVSQLRKSIRERRKVEESFKGIGPSGGVPEGYRQLRVAKNGRIQYQNIRTGQFAWSELPED